MHQISSARKERVIKFQAQRDTYYMARCSFSAWSDDLHNASMVGSCHSGISSKSLHSVSSRSGTEYIRLERPIDDL